MQRTSQHRARAEIGDEIRCYGMLRPYFSMTIIRVMSGTMPLAAVKAHFSEVADRVEKQQERIVVTRNGRPAVILISPDDLESLEETLAILSDQRLMSKIRKGLAELEADEGIPLEKVLEGRGKG